MSLDAGYVKKNLKTSIFSPSRILLIRIMYSFAQRSSYKVVAVVPGCYMFLEMLKAKLQLRCTASNKKG